MSMNILYLIVVGLVAGRLAGQVMSGGGYGSIVVAFVGAVILVWTIRV